MEEQKKDSEPDINDQLVFRLQSKNEIQVTSVLFRSVKEPARKVDLVYDLLNENNLLPDLIPDLKNGKTSEEFRKKGNEMFKKRNSKMAHEFYTNSIACAEIKSENLALAFANRSAVLFENGLFDECIRDIKQALKNNYPEQLRSKLVARSTKAEELLSGQTPVSFATKAPLIPEESQNASIQSAFSSVELQSTANEGRFVVATRDIEPGEIIVVERPFCQILLEELFTHCHHCLKLCYALLPCEGCSQSLYCSEACIKEAQPYHRYECPILLTFAKIRVDKLKLLPMKMAVLQKDRFKELDRKEEDGVYRSDRYYEIHNLVANTERRSVADMFDRSATAAIVFHLVKSYTTFFKGNETDLETPFKELVLLHLQTAACNFHEILELKSSSRRASDADQIGAGAFSFLSMFNHSCCPNVCRTSYGSTSVLVAIESIKMGQQCFDNYGQHHALLPKKDRQAKLKKQYLFDCRCVACEEDYPLYANLKKFSNFDLGVTTEEFSLLLANDLETARKCWEKVIRKIKQCESTKPNKNLAELQETLKQCVFIHTTVQTPI